MRPSLRCKYRGDRGSVGRATANVDACIIPDEAGYVRRWSAAA